MVRTIKKLYYSIGEVSKITGLKPHVLRYWESEFSQLSPAKNRAGNRIYREKDIELIHLIKNLLYEKKFTIEGAKKYLKEMKRNVSISSVDVSKEESLSKKRILEVLQKIKLELIEIANLLDKIDI
ncbi:MAG: MerR family transcriptional regulator [Candidatus Marinimicrobia bacterium]|nr:MerR family transcriptional regulator [Candidatus Neomarinimicrobiota bacterium]